MGLLPPFLTNPPFPLRRKTIYGARRFVVSEDV
jgi:hypothetical protein